MKRKEDEMKKLDEVLAGAKGILLLHQSDFSGYALDESLRLKKIAAERIKNQGIRCLEADVGELYQELNSSQNPISRELRARQLSDNYDIAIRVAGCLCCERHGMPELGGWPVELKKMGLKVYLGVKNDYHADDRFIDESAKKSGVSYLCLEDKK